MAYNERIKQKGKNKLNVENNLRLSILAWYKLIIKNDKPWIWRGKEQNYCRSKHEGHFCQRQLRLKRLISNCRRMNFSIDWTVSFIVH